MKIITLILAALILCGCDEAARQQRDQARFSAWCKVYGNTNLTYAEWADLRNEHLLPGQPPKQDNSGDVALGIAIGGAMSAGRR